MAGQEKLRRLTRGPSLSLLGRYSLWLDEDHLLSVERSGMRERYRRYCFDDVQALIIRRTRRRLLLGVALGIVTVLGLAIYFSSDGTEGEVFGAAVAGLFCALLVVNLIKGGGCVCHLQTSVSLAELHAIKRLKAADATLAALRVGAARVQGESDPEALAAEWKMRQSSPSARPGSSSGARTSRRHLKTSGGGVRYSGAMHLGLFSLLLADAVFALLAFAGNFPVLVGLRIIVVMVAAFLAVAALVRYREAVPSSPLRTVTILAAVYLAVGAGSIYGLFFGVQVRHPEVTSDAWMTLRMLAEASPYDGIWWLILFGANAGISALIGAFGLLKATSFRERRRRTTERSAKPPILPDL